jgi:hypothetical protein
MPRRFASPESTMPVSRIALIEYAIWAADMSGLFSWMKRLPGAGSP